MFIQYSEEYTWSSFVGGLDFMQIKGTFYNEGGIHLGKFEFAT